MRRAAKRAPILRCGLAACALLFLWPAEAYAACSADAQAFGQARTETIVATGGPVYGAMTHQPISPSFLGQDEVVLTFDDGPHPVRTRAILDTLDRYCAKATFFMIGERALEYPDVVREVAARGHTLASHTFTHTYRLPRMTDDAAALEIDRGFAAVVAAAGGASVAPFFRFPGLGDSARVIAHLGALGIATFTVDIVTNDSYIASSSRLTERTLAAVVRQHGGILLFHDIKLATVRALPGILEGLKQRGFRIVHMASGTPVAPNPALLSEMTDELLARDLKKTATQQARGPSTATMSSGGVKSGQK